MYQGSVGDSLVTQFDELETTREQIKQSELYPAKIRRSEAYR